MSDICTRCERPILAPIKGTYRTGTAHVVRAVVQHAGYGCDTGCCGHVVAGFDCEGRCVFSEFHWGHPDEEENKEIWARSVAGNYMPGTELDLLSSEIRDTGLCY